MTKTGFIGLAPSRASWLGVLLACAATACGATESPPARSAAAPPSPPAYENQASEPHAEDDEVVAGMQQGFRECYQIGLWNNPHQSGSVRLVLKLDPRGRPASVTPLGGAGLDRMVLDCLVKVARRGSFARPTGDGNVVVPLVFRSDRARETSSN